jgi:pyruvate dehydrogenase (quinone)
MGGNLSTMACGLPFVIAAQFAYPNRQCVAFVGDGGFTMLMGEFATAVKYKLPIKVVVLKNDHYSRIISEDNALGIPPFGTELQPIDFVRFAEACGGAGFACARPEDVGPALEAACGSLTGRHWLRQRSTTTQTYLHRTITLLTPS